MTTFSGQEGAYRFEGLAPAVYTVSVQVPEGWVVVGADQHEADVDCDLRRKRTTVISAGHLVEALDFFLAPEPAQEEGEEGEGEAPPVQLGVIAATTPSMGVDDTTALCSVGLAVLLLVLMCCCVFIAENVNGGRRKKSSKRK